MRTKRRVTITEEITTTFVKFDHVCGCNLPACECERNGAPSVETETEAAVFPTRHSVEDHPAANRFEMGTFVLKEKQ